MANPKETVYINIGDKRVAVHSDERLYDLIMAYLAAHVSGDITITTGGVTGIGVGKVTATMLSATLLKNLVEHARVDHAHVDFSRV